MYDFRYKLNYFSIYIQLMIDKKGINVATLSTKGQDIQHSSDFF